MRKGISALMLATLCSCNQAPSAYEKTNTPLQAERYCSYNTISGPTYPKPKILSLDIGGHYLGQPWNQTGQSSSPNTVRIPIGPISYRPNIFIKTAERDPRSTEPMDGIAIGTDLSGQIVTDIKVITHSQSPTGMHAESLISKYGQPTARFVSADDCAWAEKLIFSTSTEPNEAHLPTLARACRRQSSCFHDEDLSCDHPYISQLSAQVSVSIFKSTSSGSYAIIEASDFDHQRSDGYPRPAIVEGHINKICKEGGPLN